MNEAPFSDDCPPNAWNYDNFEYKTNSARMRSIIARAYFVSKQTGSHHFFAICDDECALEIKLPQYNVTKTLLMINRYVAHDWTARYDILWQLSYSYPLTCWLPSLCIDV